MKVIVSENAQQLGKKAAELTAQYLREAIAEKGSARIILSTGASQFTTLEAAGERGCGLVEGGKCSIWTST